MRNDQQYVPRRGQTVLPCTRTTIACVNRDRSLRQIGLASIRTNHQGMETRFRRIAIQPPSLPKNTVAYPNKYPIPQIAKDLAMSTFTVRAHLYALCRQESVNNRHELAQKLNHPPPPRRATSPG